MSEYITIQVGQCGNQIGSSFWKYVIKELGVQISSSSGNKSKTQPATHRNVSSADVSSFFWCPNDFPAGNKLTLSDLENASVKARAVCIDMEDSVVARFRRGPLRVLFDDNCLLTNYPGSGNNWAEGYFSHGSKYYDAISERIRKAAERCESLHGFLLLYSLGGGTGSGLGSRVLNLLEEQYPDVDRLVTCVYPAGSDDVITAPYNVILSTYELMKKATCVFPVDNTALTDIANKLRTGDQKDKNRHFQDLNNIIVTMLLQLTSGSRFPGPFNMDMNDLATNMVPFPSMHFLNSSLSPLTSISMKPPPPGNKIKIEDVFTGTYSRFHHLLKFDPLNGMLLGTTFIAGGDATLCDLRLSVEKFQKKGKFIFWNKGGVRVGLSSIPPPGHSASVLGLFNSSATSSLFRHILTQFQTLYKRKAHVHHYTQTEGFEIDRFAESTEHLLQVATAYEKLDTQHPTLKPRTQVI